MFEDEEYFKIILPAGQIPEKSIVTKATGKVTYTLIKEIVVYGEEGDRRLLRAHEGCMFLLNGDNGTMNAIPDTKELVWFAPEWQLRDFLDTYSSNEEL